MAASRISRVRVWAVSTLAVLLVLLALLLSGVRILAASAPEFRAQAEALLSELLDQPLTLGGLRAQWYGRHPVLILEDVELRGEEAVDGLRLDELEVGIDLLRSLRNRQLVPAAITVQGLGLTLERLPSGELYLQGWGLLPVGKPGAALEDVLEDVVPGLDPELLAQAPPTLPAQVHLRDASLTFIDHIEGDSHRLGPVHLQLDAAGDRYRLAGALRLPESVGEQGRFLLDWQGSPARGRGELYLDLDAVELDSLRRWLPEAIELPPVAGRFDGELWADLERSRLTQLQGHLRLSGVSAASEPLLRYSAARFTWAGADRGWDLTLHELELATAAGAWPRGGANLRFRRDGNGGSSLALASDYLRLEDLGRLAAQVPQLGPGVHRQLADLDPHGELRGLQAVFAFGRDGISHYQVEADFRELALRPVGGAPGVHGISGELAAWRDGGQMRVDGRDGELLLPRLFREPLPFQRLQGDMYWWVEPGVGWQAEVPELTLESADADAVASVRVFGDDHWAPFLDIRAHIARADAGSTHRYLPVGIMHRNLVDWLDQAIGGGRLHDAEVLVFGRSDRFPYAAGDGVFEVRAQVADGRLNYMPDWPAVEALAAELRFAGPKLEIEAHDGRIFDARVRHLRATIANLGRAHLELAGELHGPGNDMLRYLAESPIGRGIRDQLALFRVDGDHGLQLRVDVPLVGGDVQVRGRLALDDATFRMPDLDLVVDGLRGEVEFTEHSLSAPRLAGHLRGRDLVARARTEGEGSEARIRVQAETNASPVLLLQQPALAPLFVGGSDWLLDLVLPGFAAGGEPGVTLRLESDLRGLEVRLPAPFAKPAEELRLFRLETRFDAAGMAPLQLRYSDLARAALRHDPGKRGFSHVALALGNERPLLPDTPGTTLRGRVAELDLAHWQRVLATGTAPSAGAESGAAALAAPGAAAEPGGSFLPPLLSVELQTPRLRAFGQSFADVELTAAAAVLGWHLRLASPDIAGTILLPQAGSRQPLEADLETLHLRELFAGSGPAGKAGAAAERAAAATPAAAADPRQAPPLDVTVARLRLEGSELGPLRLRTERVTDGLVFEELTVDSRLLGLEGSGSWLWRDGQPATEMSLRFRSRDVGTALELLGYASMLRGGSGDGSFDLRWPGAPEDFLVARTDGELSFQVRNGHLPAVEPGAGRVLGLLSVTMLPRRLALDFSDLFGRGFAFDQMGSRMQLKQGVADLDYFYIRGPAAQVEADGRINLASGELDQRVVVTPRVSSVLPLVGGVLTGGPVGAFAAFVTQKALEREIDKLTRHRYRVRGDWNEPVIERLGSVSAPPAQLPEPFAPTRAGAEGIY